MTIRFARAALAAVLVLAAGAEAQTLSGWATLPAATFAEGPTSGQFAGPNPYGTHPPPYVGRQPVQGFSGVLPGPRPDTFHFLVDNGFGTRANSADALLRVYTLRIDWKTRDGGSGTAAPADRVSGGPRASFDASTHLTLSDPRRVLAMPIQADHTRYYDDEANPPVDDRIRSGRLLTGADLDVESLRRDRDGHYWFGDEFGPYLVETDADGVVLRAPIPLPGVRSPENAEVRAGTAGANLPGSGGFEGLALDASGRRLYALLEKTVAGDPARTLRIHEFDLASKAYTGVHYLYPLDEAGTAIGDMTAVDDHRFLVLERNDGTATNGVPPFKRIYRIDLEGVPHGGEAKKSELVDLMRLPDPDDLDGDGSTVFGFPYVTVEALLVLDPRTLLVANDNNLPSGGGRERAADDTEFLRIALPEPLR